MAIAVASFAETIPPEKRDYMFVMEDTDTGRLAGVCAIKGAVGLNEPFYNYRIGTLVHSSRELDVFTRMETLYLSNDLTGSTGVDTIDCNGMGRAVSSPRSYSSSAFRIDPPAAPRIVLWPSSVYLIPRIGHSRRSARGGSDGPARCGWRPPG